jgi:hypothetical protein
LKKKQKEKMKEEFRIREEKKLCPVVRSGNSEIGKLCHHKDLDARKCRSHAHFGCAKYKDLKSKGLI